MVQSDGNGGYIVDKKLWGSVLAALGIFVAITVWGAIDLVGGVKEATVVNEAQKVQIENIIETSKDRHKATMDYLREMKADLKADIAKLEKD